MSLFCRNNRTFPKVSDTAHMAGKVREGHALNACIKDTLCKQLLIRSHTGIIRSSATTKCLATLTLQHLLCFDHNKTVLWLAIKYVLNWVGFSKVPKVFQV